MGTLSRMEARSLTVGPDSLTWRYASDPRLVLAGGYVQLMHLTHPTVGAGVRDFSSYQADPFGRLQRTLDYINLITYSSPEDAVEVARRVRDLHRPIKGVHADGTRYSAFEPEAFTWVQATLIDGLVTAADRLVGPRLSDADRDQLYREQVGLGRLLGVREGSLPDSWAEFEVYRDEMVESRLTFLDTAHEYIQMLKGPASPSGLPRALRPLWPALRAPGGHAGTTIAFGLLPQLMRDRLGITWPSAKEQEFRTMTASLRRLTPLLPRRVRVSGPRALERRAAPIAQLPFAPHS